MPVISCNPRWSGRSASGDENYTREYVQEYDVFTDDAADGPLSILNSALVPQLGDLYPTDTGARVSNRQAVQNDADPRAWVVTVTYSSKLNIAVSLTTGSGGPGTGGGGGGGGSEQSQDANPLLRGPVYEISTETYQRAITQDLTVPDPLPLENSAGEPFDPPVVLDDAYFIVTVTHNKPSYNWYDYKSLLYTCNADLFLGVFPATTALFTQHRASSRVENNQRIWEVTNTFRINDAGWYTMPILDQGFRVNDPDEGIVELVDARGEKLTRPRKLDGAGQLLDDDEPPVYLAFIVRETANFSVLE